MTSAHKIFSMTARMSSWMQHLPGVLLQQEKQPRQGLISSVLTLRVSIAGACLRPFSAQAIIPSRKALVKRQVLLRLPLGLPLIARMFIGRSLLRRRIAIPGRYVPAGFFGRTCGRLPARAGTGFATFAAKLGLPAKMAQPPRESRSFCTLSVYAAHGMPKEARGVINR